MSHRIQSFANKETKRIYLQEASKTLPREIQRIALRKLIMMDNAEGLNDLRVPPANHLERLTGDRAGQYSIRINDRYRICFRTGPSGFYDVEICDYHR